MITEACPVVAGNPVNQGKYAAYCPGLPGLGGYLDSLDGKYSGQTLALFAAAADLGAGMLIERMKSGILTVWGKEAGLTGALGRDQALRGSDCQALVRRYGSRILADPEKTRDLFSYLGSKDKDGAMLFNEEGDLVGVGVFLNQPDIGAVNGQLPLAMKLCGKGHDEVGTRHLAALWSTRQYPVQAVTASESHRHTAMAMNEGKVVRDLVFDPVSGLYGSELIDHLDIE